MSTQFFSELVSVTIKRGEDSVASIGSDIRNVLLVTSHNRFSDAYRKYQSLSEMLLDGFTSSDFAYQFARLYFSAAVDPYDRPSLLITGGVILENSEDYIFKIKKALNSTNNFGFVVTDIRYRTGLNQVEEYQFIFDLAEFIQTTEKFYAVWLDEAYIPSTLTWILNASEDVVLTEDLKGLVTESTTEDLS